jgi:glycosyltransferase involved in cell wall biosynthesis
VTVSSSGSSLRHATPRTLTLAASIAWRHVTSDPARAVLLARRLLDRNPRRVAAASRAAARPPAMPAPAGGSPADPVAPPDPVAPAVPVAPARDIRRILHIVTDALPSTSAGYTIRTHDIARAQRDAGLDPHVVTAAGFPVTQGILDGRRLVTLDGVPYHRLLPWTIGRDPGLRRLVSELKPDVLHAASDYKNARTALALRDTYGIPVVYEVRGFWEDTWVSRQCSGKGAGEEETLRAGQLYQRLRAEETACMNAADLVVTLGEAMRDEIVSRGIAADKVVIVPNAVDERFLQPLAPAAHDGFTVGTVTTLNAYEGLDTLLDAVGLLNARGIPARTLIVGDGPELQPLRRQAESAGVPATFTGRVPAAKVREYHALLDVFVVPRTRDRVCQLVTPLKPVEAMASGLCVVTSEVSALAEIVKHEVTGTLTVPQDPVSLADCLEWLFYSPDIRTKLGAAAREWVAADRTWEANAARYIAAYERLKG